VTPEFSNEKSLKIINPEDAKSSDTVIKADCNGILDAMIEHPDSKNILEKLTTFKKDCKMLENGEMNPEKQDSCPLPKGKFPVIKKKKSTNGSTRKKRTKTKVHTLPESSKLDLQKAKDPKNYKPPNWPNKKYVPATNDLPEYRQYWLDFQKKTIKANRRKKGRLVQKQKKQEADVKASKIPVLTINESGSNLDSGTLKPVLKRVCPPDSTVPLKGPCCARCDKNQYCLDAGVAIPSVRSDCLLQGNLHIDPCIATVSGNQYSNESIAESLYLKSFE
ncbi:MAG: hypothetical protein GY858_06380, partial [Candidatus Omnitrophica bacterium]|nr:hypothetical protein [Candidatus Omnitrophota bacterium]